MNFFVAQHQTLYAQIHDVFGGPVTRAKSAKLLLAHYFRVKPGIIATLNSFIFSSLSFFFVRLSTGRICVLLCAKREKI